MSYHYYGQESADDSHERHEDNYFYEVDVHPFTESYPGEEVYEESEEGILYPPQQPEPDWSPDND